MEPKVIEIAKNQVCKLSLVICKKNDDNYGYLTVESSDDKKYFTIVSKALRYYQYESARLFDKSLKALEKRFERPNDIVISRGRT